MTPQPIIQHQNSLSSVVILYLVAVILPVRYTVGPLQLTGLRTFLIIMLIPIVIRYFRSSPKGGKPSDLLLVMFVMWALIAFFQTSPSHAMENTGVLLLELLGGYLIGRGYIRSAEQFFATIKAIIVVLALSLPFAIYESLSGDAPLIAFIAMIPGVNSVSPVSIDPRLGLERVQVFFAHPIHFGLFSSTMTALIFIGTQNLWPLWLRALGLMLAVLSSFLALSSGAFLSVLLQLFMIFWMIAFPAKRMRWVCLIVVCILSYLIIDLASNRSPVRVFLSYATYSAHNAYWRSIIFDWGMVNLWQNPVFGIGLNDWIRPDFMRSGSMDNFWLVLAVRYGVPGFVLFVIAYLFGLIRVMFVSLPTELQSIRLAWVICFIGLTFSLCTVHVWTSIFSFVFFLFGAGLWLLDQSPASSQAKRETPRFSHYRLATS